MQPLIGWQSYTYNTYLKFLRFYKASALWKHFHTHESAKQWGYINLEKKDFHLVGSDGVILDNNGAKNRVGIWNEIISFGLEAYPKIFKGIYFNRKQ